MEDEDTSPITAKEFEQCMKISSESRIQGKFFAEKWEYALKNTALSHKIEEV